MVKAGTEIDLTCGLRASLRKDLMGGNSIFCSSGAALICLGKRGLSLRELSNVWSAIAFVTLSLNSLFVKGYECRGGLRSSSRSMLLTGLFSAMFDKDIFASSKSGGSDVRTKDSISRDVTFWLSVL
ncbi:hypothetical protein ES702_03134 [subsurface metagenome]